MKEVLSLLADVAQLVFVDQRGNGRSDRSTADRWNLDTWINDVPAFCEALELERPILIGQSFGGFVALGVAARHPQLPAKLIVSSSAARIRMDRSLAMFERLGGAEARAAAERNFTSPGVETRAEYSARLRTALQSEPARPERLAPRRQARRCRHPLLERRNPPVRSRAGARCNSRPDSHTWRRA
jgi:proline iminopeptidase